MMHGSPGRSRSLRQVFGPPILIAVTTSIGLASALLWDEGGRYIAWMTPSLPVVIVIWILLRRRLDRRSLPKSGPKSGPNSGRHRRTRVD